jgi:hypothetical protein
VSLASRSREEASARLFRPASRMAASGRACLRQFTHLKGTTGIRSGSTASPLRGRGADMTAGYPAAGRSEGPQPWDESTWELVWEQLHGPLERHGIAMSLLRRRPVTEAFEARVTRELARRWRRRAVSLGLLYSLWTLFWGALARASTAAPGAPGRLVPHVMASIGLLAVAICLAFRARLRSARPSPRRRAASPPPGTSCRGTRSRRGGWR